MIQPIWKTVWRFLKRLGLKPPYDPEISVLGIYSEKAMATHSSTLAWKIPWMEEPGRL